MVNMVMIFEVESLELNMYAIIFVTKPNDFKDILTQIFFLSYKRDTIF